MTYWILKSNGQVISRSSVIPLRDDQKEQYANDMKQLDKVVAERYKQDTTGETEVIDNDDLEDPVTHPDLEQVDGGPEAGTSEGFGEEDSGEDDEGPTLLQHAEVYLPHGSGNEVAKVIGRKRDANGKYVGKTNPNPMLDSRVFTVRFPDGDEKDISYNILSEHLYSQVDEEGNYYYIYKEIINHHKK